MTNDSEDVSFFYLFFCVPSDVLTSGLRQPFVIYI